jgi:hypothetical protein
MHHLCFLVLAWVAVAAACSPSPSPAQRAPAPEISATPPEGTRSQEAVAAARRDAGGTASAGVESPHPGVDGGTPPPVRTRIEPLTRFRLLPIGEAAIAPARSALDPLRARYVGYGFELGPVVPMPSPPPRSCAELLTRQLTGRGTLFVLPGDLACSTRFGEVNPVLKTAVVPLAPLGPRGPVAQRRLEALLGSMVGELLGLSMPCSDGKTCCALRTAADPEVLDARAAAPCPAHASELDRIREAAGMQ